MKPEAHVICCNATPAHVFVGLRETAQLQLERLRQEHYVEHRQVFCSLHNYKMTYVWTLCTVEMTEAQFPNWPSEEYKQFLGRLQRNPAAVIPVVSTDNEEEHF